MVTPPIRLERKFYRGSKESLRSEMIEWNRKVERLEAAINALIEQQTDETQIYRYRDLAHTIKFDVDFVREVCFSIDAGHNGFTVFKPK